MKKSKFYLLFIIALVATVTGYGSDKQLRVTNNTNCEIKMRVIMNETSPPLGCNYFHSNTVTIPANTTVQYWATEFTQTPYVSVERQILGATFWSAALGCSSPNGVVGNPCTGRSLTASIPIYTRVGTAPCTLCSNISITWYEWSSGSGEFKVVTIN